MDLLLVHGYFLSGDPQEQRIMRPYPPLGILYLSAYLKGRGFGVEVFDGTFESPDDFRRFLRECRPPVVGFYCNMMTRRCVVPLLAYSKSLGIQVVVGGPDPAEYVGEYLDHGADVVVIGEGEETVAELLPALLAGKPGRLSSVDGIAFRNGTGEIVRTRPRAFIENLDVIPFPDREALDIRRYIDVWRHYHGTGSVSLITARGCPYRCTWCSHSVYGYSHRRRSPQNVADELALIREAYDPDIVWYADDVFTIHHRWLHKYATELGRRNLKIPFETITREDRLNEKVVQTLASMGCYRIWIGAESMSQRILDAMKRRTDVERVVEMVHLLRRYGIETGMFIMLGYEGEEEEDIVRTVEGLKKAAPDVFLTTVAYPIKGTPYYDEVADRVVPGGSWLETSDRDHNVAGRYSQRYYRFALRWMHHAVTHHREWGAERRNYRKLAGSFVQAGIGRLGMHLARNRKESHA